MGRHLQATGGRTGLYLSTLSTALTRLRTAPAWTDTRPRLQRLAQARKLQRQEGRCLGQLVRESGRA